MYTVFFIGSKMVRTTDSATIDQMEWNESFDIRVNLQSPLESHLSFEVSCFACVAVVVVMLILYS